MIDDAAAAAETTPEVPGYRIVRVIGEGETASALASDLRRHLRDEPILARPAGTVYQLQKFARRNKALVGGLAATFVALVLGLTGTLIGLVQARAERDAEAATAQRWKCLPTSRRRSSRVFVPGSSGERC